MAGYSKIYCVGEEGFDGLNPILFQILVGDADRQWLEVNYIHGEANPLKGVTNMVPNSPNDRAALLDACILFYPSYFSGCPSFSKVVEQMKPNHNFDFNGSPELIPAAWEDLRTEARPLFEKLSIFSALLKKVQ